MAKENIENIEVEETENVEEKEESKDSTKEKEATISVSEMKRRIAAEQKKFNKQIEEMKAEYELEKEKAKMTKEEKKSFELKQKEKELEEYRNKVKKLTLTSKATSVLAEKGIKANEEILSYVIRDDEDSTLEAIENFKELIDGLVNERVKESARQSAPTDSRVNLNTDNETVNKAEWARKHRIIKN